MNRNSRLVVVVALQAFLAVANSGVRAENRSGDESQEYLVIYRDNSGSLTKESRRAAQHLKKKAKLRGFVTIWVVANTPFNPALDQLSVSQQEAQQGRAQTTLNLVFEPLIVNGQLRDLDVYPTIRGPGRMIKATKRGIDQLVKDHRILQIAEARGSGF